MPAINNGAAAPAVVNVKIPPAMVKHPPVIDALVPTPLTDRHLCKRIKGENLKPSHVLILN